MKTKYFYLVILLVGTVSFAADWRSVGNLTSATEIPHGVEVKLGSVAMRVVALSPSVVRVRYAQNGTFPPDHSFAVIPETGFVAPTTHITQNASTIEFSTAELRVRINKAGGQIAFLTPAGDTILQDEPGTPAAFNGSEVRVWKTMPVDEHYFGLGEKAGALDRRDSAYTMWNTDAYGYEESTDPLYKDIPFFIGLRKGAAYGVFFDNTYKSSFDFGKERHNVFSFGADGGELNYYFFYGPHPKKVVESYTALTGRTPLPALFTLGFQQSRYSYYPEARVRDIAAEFRKRKIPCDVLYLDIDYQKDYLPFTINRQYFPNFEGLIADLAKDGFHTVLITDLHIGYRPNSDYAPYNDGHARKVFVTRPDGSEYVAPVWPGPSVFPDFTRKFVRDWWGGLYKDFYNIGAAGFWNDMNGPAVFETPTKTMPLDNVHYVDDRKTDHREIHNVVGLENVHATYDGLLRLKPDHRPFVLTRAAYAGAQRYAATWTGDNTSSWNHFRISIPMLLGLGVSGYGMVGDDIGGYRGSPQPDLLTRWIELGAFNPFFRDHTEKNSLDQEPWVHGPEHEAIRRRYIEARYRLLPYVYTAAEAMSRTGVPMMRPLFMEFPNDPNEKLQTEQAEFMFGDDLLVAPKVHEFVGAYTINLPTGTWYNYWTGERVEAVGKDSKVDGKEFKVDAPLDTLPVYVRAGAIVPHQPLVQSTSQVPDGPLELRVYPGANCQGSLYTDDGKTFAYKQGQYQRVSFTCEASASGVRVNIAKPEGQFTPWWKSIQVTVVGLDHAPSQVQVGNANATDVKFDANTRSAAVVVPSTAPAEVSFRY